MSSTHRTILAVTGSRADFGLMRSVMHAIDRRADLRLVTAVAGAHWVSGTWADLTEAGFEIDHTIQMQRPGATGRAADVQALGRGIAAYGRCFEQVRPDVVLLLGDRVEAFAAASAAAVGGFRIGHIHGGDRAEGVADESMRHAVSKMAHLHFAATDASAERLRRMGEETETIFHVGSPALDALRDVAPAPSAPQVLCLQHPIGADDRQEQRWMAQTLEAIRGLEALVLQPNGDPGADGIRAAIKAEGVASTEHLRRSEFLSLLSGAQMVVGNSSAGLIESAALGTPAVNIGPRQAGREKPASVVDADYGLEPVRRAMQTAAEMKGRRFEHPYGDGRAGEAIAEHLASVDLESIPVRKQNSY